MKKDELISEARIKKVLANLGKREDVIRAQIRGVAQGYVNAVFVHGPGGLGKTHIITSELEAVAGKSWQHHTAYSTPKALMISLASFPDVVHLFEDCEKLYKTDVASSILRAACGSPRQKERWVTYETAHETLRVNFRGALVIVSNENLSRQKGPLAAVASRFRPVEWNLTVEERIARIIDIATKPWERGVWNLTPAECTKVARFLVDEMLNGEIKVAVDIRTFVEHALPAFAQYKFKDTLVDWKEIVRTKLSGVVSNQERKGDKSTRLSTLALSLSTDKSLTLAKRIERWKEQTGLGQAIYYRYLKSSKAGGR